MAEDEGGKRTGGGVTRKFILGVALALIGTGAVSQSPSAETEATATKLVAALNLQVVLDRMFQQITPLVTTSIVSAIEQAPDTPADLKARLGDPALRPRTSAIISEEILKSYRARYPDLMKAVAHEYAAKFTEADLQAALAFYQTPAGQRFIAAQPQLQADMSEAGRVIGKAAGTEALPRAIGRIRALPVSGLPGK